MGEPFLGDGGVAVEQASGLGLELVEQGSLVVIRSSSKRSPRSLVSVRATCAPLHGAPGACWRLGYALPRDADRDRDALRDRRCARAARCPGSSRRTTTACTWSSSGAPARVRARSSPSGWPARSARAIGLAVPDLVGVEVDPALGDAEPDEEIHDLVRRQRRAQPRDGLPARRARLQPGRRDRRATVIDPAFAADVVWLDASSTNPDRTAQNPNLLVWHGRPWLIDHGAALYIHHTWRDPDEHARRPFERIADHVLLPYAGSIADGRRAACRPDRRSAADRPGRRAAGRVAAGRSGRPATRRRSGPRTSAT